MPLIVGQCHTDPVTGVAGDIYTAWTGAVDAGLTAAAKVSGSTTRALLAAQVEALAASIVAAAGGTPTPPYGNVNPGTVHVTCVGAVTLPVFTFTPAVGEVWQVQFIGSVRSSTGGASHFCFFLGFNNLSGTPVINGSGQFYANFGTISGSVSFAVVGADVVVSVTGSGGQTRDFIVAATGVKV